MVSVEARVVDPTHLELAKPLSVARGRTVVVSVTDLGEPDSVDADWRQWQGASADALRDAYGPSEPEYTPAMVREPNPDYRG